MICVSFFHYETQNQTFFSQFLRHSAYLHIYIAYTVYSLYSQDTSSPLTSLEPVRDTCAKHQATNVVTAKQPASKQAGTDMQSFFNAPVKHCSLFGWIGTEQNVIPIHLSLKYHTFVVNDLWRNRKRKQHRGWRRRARGGEKSFVFNKRSYQKKKSDDLRHSVSYFPRRHEFQTNSLPRWVPGPVYVCF